MSGTSLDSISESLEQLQAELDAFHKSLAELCRANGNKPETLELRKNLEEYYSKLLKDLLSRYESLKPVENNQISVQNVPNVEPEVKQTRNEDGEKKEAKKGEENFGGYTMPKIWPTLVRRRLSAYCRGVNRKRLLKYLIDNRKDHVLIRGQLPVALCNANGTYVVLDAIEGYDFSESGSRINDGKGFNRRACILLMECLFPVLGSNENASVAKDVQDRATKMARVWREKMGLDKSLERASKLDIQAFLQLLVTFRIGKDFEQDWLCEILLQIASLRESPALALFLGLSPKMPDFVDRLSKNGEWIEAVRYVHVFGIMDKIKPADLLKSYLEDANKAVEDIVKNGGGSTSSLLSSTMREIDAINTVINVVKEYNLEDTLPLDDLQNKLKRLEKVKEIRSGTGEWNFSKQPRKEDEESIDAKKEEENFGGYSIPKIMPTVVVRRRILAFCKAVHGKKLLNYLIKNRKDHVLIRDQLPVALSNVSNGAEVVFDAIKYYDFSERGSRINDEKKSINRRACISLMECLFPVLGSNEYVLVAKDIQDRAREMARVWRENMGLDKSLESASKLDIQAFLQLLVTFRIGKDFEQDELCEMLLQIASLRESPALALFLALSPKMTDFVDRHSKNGQWIEAVRYAHAFGLMDKIKPADMLKSYLEDAKKAAEDIVKKGGGSRSSLLNSTTREMDAINTVIKVVKEYNLEDMFPLDDLQNKLERLEIVKDLRARNKFKKRKNEVNRKAAESTPDNKMMVTTLEEKKAADANPDKISDALEKEWLKRLHSPELLKGDVKLFGIHGPPDLGFYRLSQRVKYGPGEMNSIGGDKEKVPYNVGLFQNNCRVYSDDHNLSSYHGDVKSSLQPSMYGSGHPGIFVTPSSTGTQPNERRGFDCYSSPSGYNNINHVGSSFYETGAMPGALGVSSGQINYEGKGLQSYIPTFVSVDKSLLESSTYASAVTSSLSSLPKNNYEIAPELNISTREVYNLSNVGSSMRGSNCSSDPNNWNDRRGLDRYMSRLGARNTHSSNSSVYDSDISAVPSSNVYDSGLQQQHSGFGTNTSNYGSVASAAGVPGKSAIDRYQFDSGLKF